MPASYGPRRFMVKSPGEVAEGGEQSHFGFAGRPRQATWGMSGGPVGTQSELGWDWHDRVRALIAAVTAAPARQSLRLTRRRSAPRACTAHLRPDPQSPRQASGRVALAIPSPNPLNLPSSQTGNDDPCPFHAPSSKGDSRNTLTDGREWRYGPAREPPPRARWQELAARRGRGRRSSARSGQRGASRHGRAGVPHPAEKVVGQFR